MIADDTTDTEVDDVDDEDDGAFAFRLELLHGKSRLLLERIFGCVLFEIEIEVEEEEEFAEDEVDVVGMTWK